jgi:Ca2+-binding RTX toxin-like protein
MALITGSTTIDWSTVSLGQVDFAAAFVQAGNRSDEIGARLNGVGSYRAFIQSPTLLAIEFLPEHQFLTLGGSFTTGGALRSLDFIDPATGEIFRFKGVFNGGSSETVTSATIRPPGVSEITQTLNGNITVFSNDTFSGTVTSLVARIGTATVTVSGGLRITGNSASANLTGTVTGISVTSGLDTISITGLSLSLDALEAALASNALATVNDLFSFIGNQMPGNDTITYTNNSATGMTFVGGAGNDTITISGPNGDTLDGGAGNDTLNGGLGQDTVTGGAGNDQITMLVTAGNEDTIDAGEGTDALVLSGVVPGNHEVVVDLSSSADQIVSIGGVADILTQTNFENLNAVGIGSSVTVTGSTGANAIIGSSGNDVIDGGAGNDTLDGGQGEDQLTGGDGNDTFIVDSVNDTVTETPNGGTDLVQSTAASFTLEANLENLVLAGNGNINGTGNVLNNVMIGNSGNNQLDGGAGDDVMTGGLGNDTYLVDSAGDKVTEGLNGGADTVVASLSYTLGTHVENLTLTGGADLNGTGNALANVLTGNSGINVLTGGSGNDTYVVQNDTDSVVENLGGGIDLVQSTAANFTLGANVEHLTLAGVGDINGTGNQLGNTLIGNSGVNILLGLAGNDILNGGAGDDSLNGGDGNDVFLIADQGEHGGGEALDGGTGTDVIFFSGGDGETLTLSSQVTAVEQVIIGTPPGWVAPAILTNSNVNAAAAGNGLSITGNAGANVLTGTAFNDVLNGSAGNDTLDGRAGKNLLIGGKGDDTFIVATATDLVSEGLNGGLDTVEAAINYVLGANVENLELTGTAANGTGNALSNSITGNGENNILIGNAGHDTLEGESGQDTVSGGAGNDRIVMDVAVGDVDTADGGIGLDALALVGTVGGTGVVTVNLGASDQVTQVDGATEGLIQNNFEDLDASGLSGTVNATGSAGANVMVGSNGNDSLSGGGGNDILDGGAGDDTLLGGDGNDVILIRQAADHGVGEAITGGAGVDILRFISTSEDETLTLAANTQVESVVIANAAGVTTGTIDLNVDASAVGTGLSITGNAGANVLTGTAFNDVLNGGAGNDTLDGGAGTNVLVGGSGNDTFLVNSATDLVSEALNGGADTVLSSLNTYMLGANVENLTLTGSADINGTGNALANILTGNNGVNKLTGGAGNDTYILQTDGDEVIENLNAGIDTVVLSLTTPILGPYVLGANVENLTLTGTLDIDGTGNALNNILTGNSGINVLTGGAGNDTYVVQNETDSVVEDLNAGIDLVQSVAANFTLGANVENLILLGDADNNGTGNGLNNLLTGNEGDNILSGVDGNDTLSGGLGDDQLFGGLGNDQLFGGVGDDMLDGGEGIDKMAGGRGDDEYVVNNVGDMITEGLNAGVDKVAASVNYTLGANLENLELLGVNHLAGIGNGLANDLAGNSGNNLLSGLAGNDTLDGNEGNDQLFGGLGNDMLIGGEGNDTLNGAAGNDTYFFGSGDGQDLVQDSSGTADKLLFDAGINPLDLVFSYDQSSHLRIAVHNTTDTVTIRNWYINAANRAEVIEAGDGQVLLSSQVDQLIQAMAAFSAQNGGISWDQAIDQNPQGVQAVLAANGWQ